MLPILAHEEQFVGQPHLAVNHGLRLPDDGHVATGNPMQAWVNHGRWIVQCDLAHRHRPVCNSAELAHRDDHRFFCSDCGNAAVNGAWRPVVWPKRTDEIERLLSVRPERVHQAWTPLMSVDELAITNDRDFRPRMAPLQ